MPRSLCWLAALSVGLAVSTAALLGRLAAQGPAPAAPAPHALPAPVTYGRPLPINLPTALQLSNVRPIDVAVASERIRLALAQLDRARVLWIPSVQWGSDYYRHDGRVQDVQGNVFDTSKSSMMLGAAPNAVFAVTDALFSPLASRQVVLAREAALQVAANDSLLAVAEAYFNVQQARGELAGAARVIDRAAELVRRAEGLAPGLAPPVEVMRARAELARRRQAAATARERWRTSSAELTRVLRLDPGAVVEPLEPPELRVTLVPPEQALDELIAVGLTNRPELAAQRAAIQAALLRVRQERLRPLIPSVLLRGAATNPAGTLAGGVFGGGLNSFVGHFGARGDFDLQLLWQLDNLGLGNRARVGEREAEQRIAQLEFLRTKDRVAAEVAQALAQVQEAAQRVGEADRELRDAAESVEKNFEGLGQTRRAGNLVLLVIRPQEAVAAVQALGQAYADYFAAVGDFNRAQFRLYRALGHPARAVLDTLDTPCPPADAPEPPAARLLPPVAGPGG